MVTPSTNIGRRPELTLTHSTLGDTYLATWLGGARRAEEHTVLLEMNTYAKMNTYVMPLSRPHSREVRRSDN
jgi:hypothetical protein